MLVEKDEVIILDEEQHVRIFAAVSSTATNFLCTLHFILDFSGFPEGNNIVGLLEYALGWPSSVVS